MTKRLSRAITILLVEHDPPVRDLLSEMLSTAGYHVLDACDAPSALHLARLGSRAVHLLLTETEPVGMPVRELVGELTQRHSELRTLYMSGKFDPDFANRLGVHAERIFLLKPFSRGELLRKLQDVLL